MTRQISFLMLFAFFTGISFADDAPPEQPAFETKEWEALSNHEIHQYGKNALAIKPEKWKHAETENYILHFRRATEARKVVRELEYNIWYVTRVLQMSKEHLTQKGHAYIFEDEAEWKQFLNENDLPEWFASFAVGDELFLNIRGTGRGGSFDTYTLAHEATHAVVARLYPDRRWPLWFNEGFAEAMSAASVAARKHQSVRRHQRKLQSKLFSPQELEKITVYPTDESTIDRFYQSSEQVVRFLLEKFPAEKFSVFAEAILSEESIAGAAVKTYPESLKSEEDFYKQYEKFAR